MCSWGLVQGCMSMKAKIGAEILYGLHLKTWLPWCWLDQLEKEASNFTVQRGTHLLFQPRGVAIEQSVSQKGCFFLIPTKVSYVLVAVFQIIGSLNPTFLSKLLALSWHRILPHSAWIPEIQLITFVLEPTNANFPHCNSTLFTWDVVGKPSQSHG